MVHVEDQSREDIIRRCRSEDRAFAAVSTTNRPRVLAFYYKLYLPIQHQRAALRDQWSAETKFLNWGSPERAAVDARYRPMMARLIDRQKMEYERLLATLPPKDATATKFEFVPRICS